MSETLFVGVARLGLHLPDARSLKGKRSRTRSLLGRIRNRHQVLVVEAGQQDLYQRATFAICALSTDLVDLEARLRRVEKTVHELWDGHILEWDVELLQM